MSNIIFIEFYNKQGFPPGKWLKEPDLCSWDHKLPCLAIRDMGMGVWRGFVGIDGYHPFYGKSVEDLLKIPEAMEIFFSVYGGLSGAGKLPAKYKSFTNNFWWLGIETCHGGDLMPLIKLELPPQNMDKMLSGQTYKDLQFIRKETNKLADMLFNIK